MGIKIKVSEISKLIIYYIVIINTCCDISVINCDIHQMRQKHNEGLAASTSSETISANKIDFKLNASELEEHIMSGLNMTTKPDIAMANISQEEYFSKYNEYLNRVNHRKRRSAKFFGHDVTNYVYGDESESVKKIFAFKHSNKSNRVESQRKRRSTNEEEITSLDFEISDREDLPTDIEESILNVFLTNDQSHTVEKSWKADQHVNDSESDYDDSNSSSDVPAKKLTLKSHRNRRRSHNHHLRHPNSHSSNKGKIQIISNKQTLRLHVYQSISQGRTLLFSKDITLPINSDETKFIFKKWVPLDLTSTVNSWLQGKEQILSIDIYCESCSKYGLKIVNQQDANQDEESKNNPTLNIIGSVVRTKRKTGHRKHGQLDEAKDYTISQKKTFCRQEGDKKCCRHKWQIDFRELGGYDYIIQPRSFDAGFCDGTCPYKYNVANNHAFFQSLARHQLKNSNVPNVCCAPTRLVDMEVLHIDENDHTRLKVTTMKKMRVMKCSCT